MFRYVKTEQFFLGRYTQPVELSDKCEHRAHQHCRVCRDGYEADELYAQKLCGAGVQKAVESGWGGGICEKTDRDSAPYAVGAVYAYGADRVVDVQPNVEPFNYDDNEYA